MRATIRIHAAVAVIALSAAAPLARGAQEHVFAQGAAPIAFDTDAPYKGAADGMVFAEGTRAINEGRWADAVAIFTKIAYNKSDHADGALYWKAYAENKLGQPANALDSCIALREQYPKSSWLEDCGALEIEIRAKNGKPVKPEPEQRNDELRLLVLNALMTHDEKSARAQLEDIANDDDASPRLREGARFLLGKQDTGIEYPEIVRISYAEGDVRIARGKDNEKETGTAWEKAVSNTPLETGFSLVTGAGRAEIELEDASTFYVDENSVLSFNDLHTTDGVPYTDVALLSGTATMHVRPYVPGEVFILRTPADGNLMSQYPDHTYARVTSYLDTTAITPRISGTMHLPGMAPEAVKDRTVYYHYHPDASQVEPAQDFAAWDKWVADRIDQRKEAMANVMKAAGLETPLPGLADLAGQGTFFDCEPYGKCWEPNGINDEVAENQPPAGEAMVQPHNTNAGGAAQTAAAQSPDASGTAKPHGPIGFIPGPSGAPPSQTLMAFGGFPCAPASVTMHQERDPATGKMRWVSDGFGAGAFPYGWTVCHAGYWVRHGKHYAWCVGKRHHHSPVHWIRSGKTLAFVPIHPKDVKGKEPVNAKETVFAVNKNHTGVERVKLGDEQHIEVLKEAPREFRAEPMPLLARAEEPHPVAHDLRASGPKGEHTGFPVSFDHKTQSFMMTHQNLHDGRSVMVSSPITNHSGTLQAHGAGFSGIHSGSSGSSGGHASGGGSASSGGGGGSHASSGGSSSSSSGASSSGGGSHH